MTASPESRESLCTALGRTVDRMVKRHPDLTIPDICAALGLAAGAVVGVGIPPGETEADLTIGNMIGTGYAHGVAAARKQRAS